MYEHDEGLYAAVSRQRAIANAGSGSWPFPGRHEMHDEIAEEIRDLAIRAFRAIDCQGLARVDFFLTDTASGDGLVLNEINTMPGFTPFSMFPRLWEASGVSYAELVDRLIQLALAREPGLR